VLFGLHVRSLLDTPDPRWPLPSAAAQLHHCETPDSRPARPGRCTATPSGTSVHPAPHPARTCRPRPSGPRSGVTQGYLPFARICMQHTPSAINVTTWVDGNLSRGTGADPDASPTYPMRLRRSGPPVRADPARRGQRGSSPRWSSPSDELRE